MEHFKTAGNILYSNIQKYLRDINIGYCDRVKIFTEGGRLIIEKNKISFEEAVKQAKNFIKEHQESGYFIYDVIYSDPCTIVIVKKNGIYKVGSSVRKEGDRNSFQIGQALAFSRAINKPLSKKLQEYLGIHQ